MTTTQTTGARAPHRSEYMRRRLAAALIAALALGACKDSLVPDLNNPSEQDLDNPSRSQIASLVRGVVIASRAGYSAFILDAEIIGRDAYNLDTSDPRWVGELLVDLDPGGFGGRHWQNRYAAVRTANLLIGGAERSTALEAEEKAAVTGFAQTMMALDLMRVYEARGSLGLPVEIGTSATDLRPILCADPALQAIADLLDDAEANLLAGGDAFPGGLPPGFEGFNTPATFIEFNRAIRAKVAIYQEDFAAALTALDESFLDTAAPLDRGVYFTYSTAGGDVTNPLYQDPATTNYRVHPSVATDAPRETVGGVTTFDARFTSKVAVGTAKTYQDVGSNLIFNVYEGLESPIPIITNEELILLRAQAELGLGGATNLVNAASDVNFIRTTAGELSPVALTTAEEIEDELLVQKRYSLLFRSPSRWVDMRNFGRLDELPLDIPEDHNVEAVFPIPIDEVNARGGDVSCQA